MTVKELIEVLKKMPQNLQVEIHNQENQTVKPLEEIFIANFNYKDSYKEPNKTIGLG